MTTLTLNESYDALQHGRVRFESWRDVILVTGPDALSYLEGQCSQHISDLTAGQSRETLLLSPQGKVDAYATVAIDNEGTAMVIVDDGCGEAAFERLRRFKLRIKAELELVRWPVVMLRGLKLPDVASSKDVAVIAVNWPGCSGMDLIGPTVQFDASIPLGDLAALECARIEAGIPAMGRELTEKTIPQEAGIVERTVSFTKGCYTGQELVARIDSRGSNVPRRLRAFTVTSDAVSDVDLSGAGIVLGDRSIGKVTSATFSPRASQIVGLSYVRRDVALPAEATVIPQAGEPLTVSITEVPLVESIPTPKD